MLDKSVAREHELNGVTAGGALALERNREQRHREQMVMLDRIATAIEAGNKLTTDVMERT